MMTDLPDGLYRVEHRDFVAGFVVEGGRVTRCAPRLRRGLAYWASLALLGCSTVPPQEPQVLIEVVEGGVKMPEVAHRIAPCSLPCVARVE